MKYMTKGEERTWHAEQSYHYHLVVTEQCRCELRIVINRRYFYPTIHVQLALSRYSTESVSSLAKVETSFTHL